MSRGRKSLVPGVPNLKGPKSNPFPTPEQGRTRFVSMIRKEWLMYSRSRHDVLQRCLVERPQYTKTGKLKKHSEKIYICELCGAECKIPTTKVQAAKFGAEGIPSMDIDHHPPLAESCDGSWDSYFSEMFRDSNGLIGLCKPCHNKVKTTAGRDEHRAQLDEIRRRNSESTAPDTKSNPV